jgi:alpha-glucosidase
MPADWVALTVQKQQADPDSTLSFFRRALELRSKRAEFDGTDIDWLSAPRGELIFGRAGGLVCALNAGKRPMALPDGELILASAPLADGQLPADAAAWLVRNPG